MTSRLSKEEHTAVLYWPKVVEIPIFPATLADNDTEDENDEDDNSSDND
jgi:hypothetical protein